MITRLNTRIDIVDALRGFSLAGIGIVHFMEQYLGAPPPFFVGNYTQHHPVDGVLDFISFILICGKFFALFSFLFGLSFALQMERGEARTGSDFRLRFAWRLVILFSIGYLHHLFYRGDILTIYALLGFPLLLFYKVSDKWILAIAIVLFIGVPRFIMTTTGYEPFKAYVPDFMSEDKKEELHTVDYWNAAKSGTWVAIARENATYGFLQKMNFQFGAGSRAYQTFAWFLLGLLAGRRRYFEELEQHRSLARKLLKWGLIGFLLLFILQVVTFLLLGNYIPKQWQFTMGMTFGDVANVALTLVYIAAFTLLFTKERSRQRLRLALLAPFGRMALTNYVMQTLIGTTLLFSFGFGLLGSIGNSITLPIAIVVLVLQIWWSKVWLRHFYFGPLEWLWRSLTWFKWQPFRRKKGLEIKIEAA